MNPEYITKKELQSTVPELLKTAKLAEYKWIYAYLKDLDEWPIVVDETKTRKGPPLEVSADTDTDTGTAEEKCPMD